VHKIITLRHDDTSIAFDTTAATWSLTDLWRAAGSPHGKEVWRWMETEQAREYLDTLKRNLAKNEVSPDLVSDEVAIIITRRGGAGSGGGTWGHQLVGLEYARYLSPGICSRNAGCDATIRDTSWGRACDGGSRSNVGLCLMGREKMSVVHPAACGDGRCNRSGQEPFRAAIDTASHHRNHTRRGSVHAAENENPATEYAWDHRGNRACLGTRFHSRTREYESDGDGSRPSQMLAV
jgi:hypothetical protein